jgi:hypothetical protein
METAAEQWKDATNKLADTLAAEVEQVHLGYMETATADTVGMEHSFEAYTADMAVA